MWSCLIKDHAPICPSAEAMEDHSIHLKLTKCLDTPHLGWKEDWNLILNWVTLMMDRQMFLDTPAMGPITILVQDKADQPWTMLDTMTDHLMETHTPMEVTRWNQLRKILEFFKTLRLFQMDFSFQWGVAHVRKVECSNAGCSTKLWNFSMGRVVWLFIKMWHWIKVCLIVSLFVTSWVSNFLYS